MERFVVALDQGTTSSRAVLFDKQGAVRSVSQFPFKQYFPQPGWVEHDPREILSTQIAALTDVLVDRGLSPEQIEAIGITNQRETTVVWNRITGEPIFNAIVWQCRRTASIIEELCKDESVAKRITATTGLIPDAYFSASKIRWILDNVEGARKAAEAGDLLFGTVDAWLVYKLTRGTVHATDPTNASRTMLYDIHRGCWDPWLCTLFDIPMAMLPEVRPSSGSFGSTISRLVPGDIPICGVAGDQQAALFGQCCTQPGQAKNTYGTGCFLLMHTGERAVSSKNNLICTIAASAPGQPRCYALEGSVFTAGALIQWLRDGLGIIDKAEDTEGIATSVESTQGVYVVPAFTGLGAPYWDARARGAIYGLTRGTTNAHIVRASLDSLAYQVNDLAAGMQEDAGMPIRQLAVDGGACRNSYLMQFQADLLGVPIVRPENTESTAAGAAYLAGLTVGFWDTVEQIQDIRSIEHRFEPVMKPQERSQLLEGWKDCVDRTLTRRS